jgi:hypothetical protein
MPVRPSILLSKSTKFAGFSAHFVAIFGAGFAPPGCYRFAAATIVFSMRVDVMPVFEEWFEYDYEEVLLGAVKAETKRKRDELLALRLRHCRPPTRPQK